MPRRSSKNNNQETHPQNQETHLTQQNNITTEQNLETINQENEERAETFDSIEDKNKNTEADSKENEKNVETYENKEEANNRQDRRTKPNLFLTKMANRIMSRLYEIYGYSIKGDRCRSIVEIAQSYARREKVTIQDNISEIYIPDLYNNILNILSLGYLPSPLDNTYNDILIKAIIDKYKI